MANMLLPQPATMAAEGEQAGQRRDIGQQTIKMNQFKFDELQRQSDIGELQRQAQSDAAIMNALLQLPPGQQQAGFQAVADRLTPDVVNMFTDPQTGQPAFNPSRAQMVRDMAGQFSKIDPETFGQPISVMVDGKEKTFSFGKRGTKIEHEGMTLADKTKGRKVVKSELLPGGVTRLVYDTGDIETVKAQKADQELIKQAEIRGAELQGLRAGEREEAKKSSKVSLESYKTLQKVKANIRNLEEGIRLLDAGAKTGVIEKRLPSVRSAAIKLDNLQARLGLDVIGNTTFGALSQGELDLALDVSLPKGLNPQELRQWITERRDAQLKLANYLTEAALFLGTPGPGHKVTDFMAQKRQAQQPAAKPAPGPQVATQPAPQQFQEGQTATNPQTGQKAIFTNGQWQPAP